VPDVIQSAGLELLAREDRREDSLAWFSNAVAHLSATGPAPPGLHLLMGASTLPKFGNLFRHLRLTVIQSVAVRT
jgi:hypothetical protein